MKKAIILLLILIFISTCKIEGNKKTAPVAVKGVLDLRDWNFNPTDYFF